MIVYEAEVGLNRQALCPTGLYSLAEHSEEVGMTKLYSLYMYAVYGIEYASLLSLLYLSSITPFHADSYSDATIYYIRQITCRTPATC